MFGNRQKLMKLAKLQQKTQRVLSVCSQQEQLSEGALVKTLFLRNLNLGFAREHALWNYNSKYNTFVLQFHDCS